jgi:hypothetical protein
LLARLVPRPKDILVSMPNLNIQNFHCKEMG